MCTLWSVWINLNISISHALTRSLWRGLSGFEHSVLISVRSVLCTWDLWTTGWICGLTNGSPRSSQWPVSSSAGAGCAPLAPFHPRLLTGWALCKPSESNHSCREYMITMAVSCLGHSHFVAFLHPYQLALTFLPSLLPQDFLSFMNVPFRAMHSTVPYPSNKTSLYSWMFTCKEKLPW